MGTHSLTLDGYRELTGQDIGYSKWLPIDQIRINAFADATQDHQFIHTDPERAKSSVFGGTIAHGFLTLALLSHLSAEALPELVGSTAALNYGFERVRFVDPVRCGDRIRAAFRLAEIREKAPQQLLFLYDVSVEIEGRTRPAMVARWLTLHIMA